MLIIHVYNSYWRHIFLSTQCIYCHLQRAITMVVPGELSNSRGENVGHSEGRYKFSSKGLQKSPNVNWLIYQTYCDILTMRWLGSGVNYGIRPGPGGVGSCSPTHKRGLPCPVYLERCMLDDGVHMELLSP